MRSHRDHLDLRTQITDDKRGTKEIKEAEVICLNLHSWLKTMI